MKKIKKDLEEHEEKHKENPYKYTKEELEVIDLIEHEKIF
jgi:hypothetical protein